MLVKEFRKNGTTYLFYDDYCRDKTLEDVKKILDNIARIAYPELRKKELMKYGMTQ